MKKLYGGEKTGDAIKSVQPNKADDYPYIKLNKGEKMTKKKYKNCKNKKEAACKHICIDCKHCYDIGDAMPTCNVYKGKSKVSCITGAVSPEHNALCIDHNKNGQCKKYEPLANLVLKKMLQDYLDQNPPDYFGRKNVAMILAEDLLDVLNEKKSEWLEEIWDGDSPYDHYIIVTKGSIEESLRHREYKLKYEEKEGENGSGKKLCEEKVKKQKLWLSKMRCFFELKK